MEIEEFKKSHTEAKVVFPTFVITEKFFKCMSSLPAMKPFEEICFGYSGKGGGELGISKAKYLD